MPCLLKSRVDRLPQLHFFFEVVKFWDCKKEAQLASLSPAETFQEEDAWLPTSPLSVMLCFYAWKAGLAGKLMAFPATFQNIPMMTLVWVITLGVGSTALDEATQEGGIWPLVFGCCGLLNLDSLVVAVLLGQYDSIQRHSYS